MPLNKAKITKRVDLTHDVIEVHFETENPINFTAGQYVSLKVNDGQPGICFRPYSIASKPTTDTNNFELTLKVVKDGRGSNWLNTVEEGTEVEFMGPVGVFKLNEPLKDLTIFVATGTGITPLKSMIEDLLEKGYKGQMHLVFGVRHEKNVFYEELFNGLSAKHDNFSFTMCLSRPECEDHGCFCGRVTAKLAEMKINPEQTEVYICGLKAMIDSVQELMISKGMPENQIIFEKYD